MLVEYMAVDLPCVCKGNWQLLVKEYDHLIGRLYMDNLGHVWHFFGLVHADDDYYYGLSRKGQLVLESCVGNLEPWYTLLPKDNDETNS